MIGMLNAVDASPSRSAKDRPRQWALYDVTVMEHQQQVPDEIGVVPYDFWRWHWSAFAAIY